MDHQNSLARSLLIYKVFYAVYVLKIIFLKNFPKREDEMFHVGLKLMK